MTCPDGCALVDLGEHRLRDLARPVRIFQLTGPGLRAEFPPVRTLAAFAGNLPVQLSSFVGRAAELAGLAAAVAGSPLVTVTGPGGVGKTRLAVQAAADLLPSFADGAWLCELAAADDGESMAQVVATALGVRSRPGLSTAGSVVEFLRTRSGLLLVLDNCEHLLAAAAALAADILRGCRGVRIVATSPGSRWGWRGSRCSGCGRCRCRRRMRMWRPRRAARRWTCSCSGPPPRAGSSRWAPRTWPRSGRSAGGWTGSRWPSSWPPRRAGALRPAQIAGLLDERFRLLTRGRAGAAGRQQTLQATVEWSYALLSETEQRLFDALGVFPASFDADAAVAVAAAAGLDRWDVLDGLTALVGQSLLAEEEGPDQASRYRLLETMRAYARQHLTAAQLTRLHRAHARFYAAFAERAGPELFGPAQLDWQHRIRAERDNLHAAITWALARGGQAPRLAFRIVTALLALAAMSPVITRGWAEACLTRLEACPPELRAPVLTAAACNAFLADDFPLAQRRAEQALAEPASGDPLTSCGIRAVLATIFTFTGQPERAIGLAREARQEAADRGIEVVGRVLAGRGGAGLDARWRLRRGAAARDGGGRDSPQGPQPRAVGDRLLRGRGGDLAQRTTGRAAAHRGQPGPDPRRSRRHRSRQRLDAGRGHPGPQRRPARSAGRAAGGDAAAPRRRHPAAPRRARCGSPPGCWPGSAKPDQPRCCPAPSPRTSRRPSRP